MSHNETTLSTDEKEAEEITTLDESSSKVPEDTQSEDTSLSFGRASSSFKGDLLDNALDFLIGNIPVRDLWQCLGKQKKAVQVSITRGFQPSANALKQRAVRNRLIKALDADHVLVIHVLELWGATDPAPVLAVRAIADDEQLNEQIDTLWQRLGTSALFWSLLYEQRDDALQPWIKRIADGETPPVTDAVTADSNVAPPTPAEPVAGEQLARARAEITKWQSRAEAAEDKLRTAESTIAATRSQHSKELQELRAVANQLENRFNLEHKQLDEATKELDRTARRLKSAQKQNEELETENKKLKKQVRQQQEINEELKKEAAGFRAKIDTLQSPPPEVSPEENRPAARTITSRTTAFGPRPVPSELHFKLPSPTVDLLDQQFVWNADGRTIRVTPRDIKRAIDRNDENFVFALIQALDALREMSAEGYKMLLDRLREIDRYYAGVLTQHTTRILVDASNVARYEKNRFGKGQIRFLTAMRNELRRRNCFPIRFIADASLPYNVDHPDDLLAMVKRGELEMSATGQEADEILAREARRSGAFVISNDRTFHHKVSPGFEPPRVGFQFYDRHVVVDEF